ncbi:MAG: pyridoxal phosphate-dependent aminotransferase [Chloroflexota bacterium]
MPISKQALSIANSPTLALNDKASALRSQGKAIINLCVGEPQNKAPLAAVESAIARLETRQVKYAPTSGTPALKKAIIQYTQENYARTPTPDNVLVTVGAKQALFNALYTLLDPQDEVILLAPYWVSYPEMVKLVYGVPVVVRPPEGCLHHRLADIESAITPRTKAILVNSPNNPSGMVYSQEFIAGLVDFCERGGIYLIMDDIYHKLVYGSTPWVPGYQYTEADIDSSRLIVINGVSKSYGMTGFRIGWVVAPCELVRVMSNIQAQTTSGASIVMQDAALGALTEPQDVVAELRESIKVNRDIAMNELRAFSKVQVTEPEGAFYVLPDCSAYNPNSTELAEFILEKALVVTVPGAAFGMEGHLRLSFAGAAEDVAEGIRRMRWALEPTADR